MLSLEGKVVLVTGAAGGFGRELTRQLLKIGSLLVLSDRDEHVLHAAMAETIAGIAGPEMRGRVLAAFAADLVSDTGCELLYRQVVASAPPIDVLINNAGLAHSGAFVDVPQAIWERLMQVNLLAPMRITARFIPDMIARHSGQIVNIASCAGLVGTPGLVSYSTSKFGLRGFGEALANELKPHGVLVSTVYPYFARTPILESEHFGSSARSVLPDSQIEDPAQVIAELISGVQAGKPHIYPGKTAKRIRNIQRLGPWAAPLLQRLGG